MIKAEATENQADVIVYTNINTGASACIDKAEWGMVIAAVTILSVRAAI
jgi:hypothetical protein